MKDYGEQIVWGLWGKCLLWLILYVIPILYTWRKLPKAEQFGFPLIGTNSVPVKYQIWALILWTSRMKNLWNLASLLCKLCKIVSFSKWWKDGMPVVWHHFPFENILSMQNWSFNQSLSHSPELRHWWGQNASLIGFV